MTCYRCVGLNENSKLMLEQHKCQGCKRTLPWSAYDPILLGWTIKNEKKRGFSEKREVYCDDCKYPPCAKCSTRPWKPPTASHLHAGQYLCQSCRYPPCAGGCGTPRPQESKNSVFKMPVWTCEKCRWRCSRCSSRTSRTPRATDLHAGEYVCQICRYPPCARGCGAPRSQTKSNYNV